MTKQTKRSVRFSPSTWTERLVPVFLFMLGLVLVAVLVIVVLVGLGII